MDGESKLIFGQMEKTRQSLHDKLETLERKVRKTVQHASESVTETVDCVQGAVRETVDTIRESFDLSHQVERHPWGILVGATVVGFFGARLLRRSPRGKIETTVQEIQPVGIGFHAMRTDNSLPLPEATPIALGGIPVAAKTWGTMLRQQLTAELDSVKALAISTVGGILRKLVTENLSAQLEPHINQLIDETTVRLGGNPLKAKLTPGSLSPTKVNTPSRGATRQELARMADDGCPNS